MPKEYLGIDDISDADINATVGSGVNDLSFTFKSAIATLGNINDNANTFSDGADNGGKLLQIWVEVKNNTVGAISFGVDYFIEVTADSVVYNLHFPEDTIAPSETEIYYFDKQGVPFYDSDLIYPAITIHEIENSPEIVDNQNDEISNYLVIDDVVNIVDFVEEYQIRELSDIITVDQVLEQVLGISVLQELGHIRSLLLRGATWILKTATAINWRLKS